MWIYKVNTISPNKNILESLPNVDVPYTSWLKDRTFGTLWLDNFAGNIFGPQPVSAQQTFLHPFRQEFSAWPDFWPGSSCPKRSAPVMTRNTASHGVHMGLSENRVHSQWNSHLIGIMISKTIGFRGTLFSDTPICCKMMLPREQSCVNNGGSAARGSRLRWSSWRVPEDWAERVMCQGISPWVKKKTCRWHLGTTPSILVQLIYKPWNNPHEYKFVISCYIYHKP